MVCLTSCGSQGLPVYTVGARGWHPDRGLSRNRIEDVLEGLKSLARLQPLERRIFIARFPFEVY